MTKNRTVAIVIVTQKEKFIPDELSSFKHLNRYLANYDKFFLIPKKNNLSKSLTRGASVIRLANKYFVSTKSYNQLVMSLDFYKLFTKYQYILIYQPDALVFSDQLMFWCGQGFDYLGAPSFLSLCGLRTHKSGRPSYVLNGGLSLRKVDTFIKVLKKAGNKVCDYRYNEDGFWSFEAPKYCPNYKLPNFKTALTFAFEKYPRLCYFLNGNRLPFGCHAWVRYGREFWQSHLLK
jgi:hypothetical protein